MRLFNTSSYAVAASTVASGKPEDISPDSNGKLCLCLFGKTCAYIGGLAIVALTAIMAIWAIMYILH